MEGRSRKLSSCVVAFLLGLAGLLLCLVGPRFPAEAQDSRVLQVWPDCSIGVTSGLLEGSTAHAATQVFPFGVCTSEGDVVQARTYLHFPLDVFPPGTQVLRATLYVYVDGVSGAGEATLGAYRVLEPWGDGGWGGDPATWPALLASPVAVTTARFDVVTPTLPVSTPVPTVIPSPTLISIPTATPTHTPTPAATPTPTATQTVTVTPTATPTATFTPTPSTSPLPTPTPSPTLTVPVVSLEQVAESWLTWDVTVLMWAWMTGGMPDDGLALAPAPEPDADPDAAGDLLVARWLAVEDCNTKPYLVVEFEVHPVTPTPTSAPVPVLPSAGSPAGWGAAGLLLVGVVLLMLGLAVQRR